MKIIRILTVTAVLISTVISCQKDYVILEEVIPEETVTEISFASDIIPILNQSCNMSGCHGAGGIPPVLSEGQAYNNLIANGMVDTANAEASVLYVRMNSMSSPMPPAGKIAQNKIDLVLTWISQGANNN